MTQDLGHDAFARNRDTPFLFGTGEGSVRLDLAEVTELGGGGSPSTGFSLLFRGPQETPLLQGTYPVEHEAMGSFALFIVPVARDAKGMSYEAIFNSGP